MQEVCDSVSVGGNDVIKTEFKERRLHGRRFCELGIKLQNTDTWRFTKKKIERLKGAFTQAKKM